MPEILPLIMRWMHILSAILLLGGFFLLRVAVMPALASTLPEDKFGEVRLRLMKRWRMVLHSVLFLLLASGFYNYLAVTRHAHAGQGIYHALFGVKFLLALGVFFLGLALASEKAWSAPLRAQPGRWYGVLLALAFAVVLIAGYMKLLPPAESS